MAKLPSGWIFIPKVKTGDRRTIEIEQRDLVMCRECKYWNGNNDGKRAPECRWREDEIPDFDDYCSWGKKVPDRI